MGRIKGTTRSKGVKTQLDKFYTNPLIAKECINKLNLEDFDCIIEPSAGSGAFSKQIPGIKAYDLAPEDITIQEQDWFTLDKSIFSKYNKILVVGNPPFGRQSTLAMSFIKESSFADVIAFILPKSFKKDSVKNRVPLNFWLVYEEDLPKDSFLLDGNKYDVPCVFQVWEKRGGGRSKVVKQTTSDLFAFTTPDKSDFRIQRVGGNAGKASEDMDVSPQSNYYIKNTSGMSKQDLIDLINQTVFPSVNDTVGPRSVSKGELVAEIEREYTSRLN